MLCLSRISLLGYFCLVLSNVFYTFQIFGSDASCASYLKVLIETLFSQTTFLLTKIQDFTSQPDIADDCFLLASRCIRYCPQLFFPSPIFPPLVDCSMVGVTVQHRLSLSLSPPPSLNTCAAPLLTLSLEFFTWIRRLYMVCNLCLWYFELSTCPIWIAP